MLIWWSVVTAFQSSYFTIRPHWPPENANWVVLCEWTFKALPRNNCRMRRNFHSISVRCPRFLHQMGCHGNKMVLSGSWKSQNTFGNSLDLFSIVFFFHSFNVDRLFRFIPLFCFRQKPTSEMFNTLSGENLSGEIFVTKWKIRHFRPTKNFAQ